MNNLYLCPALKNQINYENSKTLLVHCHCIDYNDKFFLHVKAMKKEDFDISGLYGKTWWGEMDLRTHTENGFTVILHSPQVLSRIMV